jgi:hypothetical protein
LDRHYPWRIVARNCKELEGKAPEGYKPVVEVFIAGRPEPVRVEFAQTSRDAANPWTWLQAVGPRGEAPDADPEKPSTEHFWVLVHEASIQSVQIRFISSGRAGRPFGFGLLDEPDKE